MPVARQLSMHGNCTCHVVGGNLSWNNCNLTDCSHFYTDWPRFTNNHYLIHTCRHTLQSIILQREQLVCNMSSFYSRGLWSACCQLAVVWLFFYIKSKLSSPWVILQLNHHPAAALKLLVEEFNSFMFQNYEVHSGIEPTMISILKYSIRFKVLYSPHA